MKLRTSLCLMLALIACAAVAGCSRSNADSPDRSDDTLIHFVSGGGYAPHLQELKIDEDGSALLFGTNTRSVSFTLGDHELASLREKLDANPPGELDSKDDSAYCADCFTYSLEYGGGKISGDQASLSASAMKLIGDVSAIADAHATQPPDPDATLVRYSVASGLPATFSVLVIENDGSARLRTSEQGDVRSTDFIVPFDRMQDVRRVLALNPAGTLGPALDPDCLDCPVLILSYGGARFETTDLNTGGRATRVADLLDRISATSAEHTLPPERTEIK